MMSLGRIFFGFLKMKCCRVLKGQLIALFCMLCLLTVAGQASHEFNLGKNVTLDFPHELKSPNSSFWWIAYLDGSSHPFYERNQLRNHGLKPGQAGRIGVKVDHSQMNVTITISVHGVQPIDEHLYIVNIIEVNNETETFHYCQAYLNVTYPPGKADCQPENPPIPSGEWLLLRCNATAGSDNTGHMVCYQNSKQVPYLEPVRHTDNFMTGLFWIDPIMEVRCCSPYNTFDVGMESCNDFVRPSSDGTVSSDKPDLITRVWSSESPSRTDDGMDRHNGKARELWLATVITGSLLGAVCLVILQAVVFYMYLKKKKENNNQSSNSDGQIQQIKDEDQPLRTELKDHAPSEPTSNGSGVFVRNGVTCQIANDEEQPLRPELKDHAPIYPTSNGSGVFV